MRAERAVVGKSTLGASDWLQRRLQCASCFTCGLHEIRRSKSARAIKLRYGCSTKSNCLSCSQSYGPHRQASATIVALAVGPSPRAGADLPVRTWSDLGLREEQGLHESFFEHSSARLVTLLGYSSPAAQWLPIARLTQHGRSGFICRRPISTVPPGVGILPSL